MITMPPVLANLPSCVAYIRPFGNPSGGAIVKDWSPKKYAITNSNVTNSTTKSRFPPASLYFNGSASLTVGAAANWAFFTDATTAWAVSLWATYATVGALFCTGTTSPSNLGVNCYLATGGAIRFFIGDGSCSSRYACIS